MLHISLLTVSNVAFNISMCVGALEYHRITTP